MMMSSASKSRTVGSGTAAISARTVVVAAASVGIGTSMNFAERADLQFLRLNRRGGKALWRSRRGIFAGGLTAPAAGGTRPGHVDVDLDVGGRAADGRRDGGSGGGSRALPVDVVERGDGGRGADRKSPLPARLILRIFRPILLIRSRNDEVACFGR
jgi:hypothetical protein